ncbi:DUF4255 domain-containing protein [Nonomuraea sp. NPDC049655]|uniref:DUF4255 domain-containing protein n=1 Tax=Nonomuraea sp. NPDC049655 TaxID=3364355 RepID=UPI0037AC24E8
MSDSTAIGMVSASLRKLLLEEFRLCPAPKVTILAPDEQGPDRRLNLFLYKLVENPFLKNQDWTAHEGGIVPPPLSLSLFYMLTAYAPNDDQLGNVTAQQLLGEAMRIFSQHAAIPARYLESGLHAARERLNIVSDDSGLEELTNLWSAFSQPFRLSVPYRVSTLQIDQSPGDPHPVPKRVRRIGVPEPRVSFKPPVVTEMTGSGTELSFAGTHLTGWQVSIWLGGIPLVAGRPLTGDTFTSPLPPGLAPGLYEVRVEISGMFRRTFLYEAAP